MAYDAAFDGSFWVGVHSTGIFCRPSCPARRPKPENIRFYATIPEAEAAGLRACKKCRPIEFSLGVEPELDRLIQVVEAVRADPSRFSGVEDFAAEAAMSVSALFAAIRTHYHTTPGAILTQARVRTAQRLLREGATSAAEAGAAAGFDSTSAYYENFRRRTGMPPAAYGRLRAAPGYTIELPVDYHIDAFLGLVGRDPASRTERTTEGGFVCGLWTGGRPMLVEGKFAGKELRICTEGEGDLFEVHVQLVRMLGLEQDPRAFEEHIAASGHGRLGQGREGLRIPQSATPFDGLVWSIVGQQVNVPFACVLRARLAQRVGLRVSDELFAPPPPDRVAELTVEDLAPLQFSRRKAEYLIGAAQRVVAGTLDLAALGDLPPARAERALLALRGLGPWSANYLMMRAFGFPDCLPLGDTGLTSALARYFDVARPDATGTAALMEGFRPHRSLATYHLWRGFSSSREAPELVLEPSPGSEK